MPRPTITKDIGVRNTILSRVGPWQAATVTLSAADVPADANGKKIVPAGTFLGTVDPPVTGESPSPGTTILGDGAKAKPANDATTEGLLFNEVDVTHGDMEASMLYMGTVGLDRIPEAPAAGVDLPRVTFTKD